MPRVRVKTDLVDVRVSPASGVRDLRRASVENCRDERGVVAADGGVWQRLEQNVD